jgi:hypothetical protein
LLHVWQFAFHTFAAATAQHHTARMSMGTKFSGQGRVINPTPIPIPIPNYNNGQRQRQRRPVLPVVQTVGAKRRRVQLGVLWSVRVRVCNWRRVRTAILLSMRRKTVRPAVQPRHRAAKPGGVHRAQRCVLSRSSGCMSWRPQLPPVGDFTATQTLRA